MLGLNSMGMVEGECIKGDVTSFIRFLLMQKHSQRWCADIGVLNFHSLALPRSAKRPHGRVAPELRLCFQVIFNALALHQSFPSVSTGSILCRMTSPLKLWNEWGIIPVCLKENVVDVDQENILQRVPAQK